MVNFTYSQLIRAGVHLGHSIKNLNLLTTWFVYGFKDFSCIIDLKKTILYLKWSLEIVRNAIFFKQPVWFINLDKTKGADVMSGAHLCGEFFCNKFWIPGMISNYLVIFNIIRRFCATPFFLRSKKNLSAFYQLASNWYLTRFTWPRVVFVTSMVFNQKVIRESYLLGIPCISIMDTNISSYDIVFGIPGNDQSSLASKFYNNLIASAILRWKFVNIFCWFNNVRNFSRLETFENWIKKQVAVKNKLFLKLPLMFNFPILSNLRLFLFRFVDTSSIVFLFRKILRNSVVVKALEQFFCMKNFFLRLRAFWALNVWSRNRFFRARKSRLRRSRLICKFGKKLTYINFFKYRLFVSYSKEVQFVFFLAQVIFVNCFFRFFISSKVKNKRTSINEFFYFCSLWAVYNKFKLQFKLDKFNFFFSLKGLKKEKSFSFFKSNLHFLNLYGVFNYNYFFIPQNLEIYYFLYIKFEEWPTYVYKFKKKLYTLFNSKVDDVYSNRWLLCLDKSRFIIKKKKK